MGAMATLVCVVTLYCLILLPAAHEEERNHIIYAEAGALWPGHCGNATEGEFSNMTNVEAALWRIRFVYTVCTHH